MYQSSKKVSTDGFLQLKSDITLFLQRKDKIYCKALKRHVFLSKLPKAITERKDAKRRLQAFEVAIDILRSASTYNRKYIKGYVCYEIKGLDISGKIIAIHIREEVVQKDRILFFVSCLQ